jgi:Zn-dependent protease
VRLRAKPQTVGQDARIGLAGPLWGTVAAILFLTVGLGTAWPTWVAIGAIGAWINVFNLLPIWQLDGGRAWNALSRTERTWAAVVLWLLALLAGDGLLFVLAIAGTARAAVGRAPEKGDRSAFLMYAGLSVVLTVIARTGAIVPR